MKFILKSCLITAFCSLLAFTLMSTFASAEPEKEAKANEKWSEMAGNIVKLNYPEHNVSNIDYKGREDISETQTKDTFELKVQNDDGSFVVRVILLFNPKSESLISLSLEERR
ncbi:DUF3889 domain-containing protein [Litchfieldia salsa]|uniref:DUF3889 domain-containing protein n=1 Tax=Litchfieldia salsa TaxID=930152 RepID=UPI001EE46C59|nr:DUF3889 domain-containing protein [Litchfieldia salsa]